MPALVQPGSRHPFFAGDSSSFPAPRAYTLAHLGSHVDGSPLRPVALNDNGDIAACAFGLAPEDPSRGFCLTGTLRVPAGVATGQAPLFGLSSNGLMAGVTGEGPRELRAWASHLGTFGERHWPDSVSIARGVNAHGLVVGNVLFDAGEFTLSRAFFVAPGTPARFLVPPQGGTTFTTGVNDAGDIIFNATPLGSGPDETQAWCMRQGAYTPIPGFNGAHSWATALSPKGLVVGHARDAAGTTRAFLWQDGHTTDLSMGGACTSEALGVNDNRTVVGRLIDSAGERRAFRWTPEDGLVRLEDLIDDRTDWHIEEAVAVNASGTIVGHGLYRGQPRGYLLTPLAS